MKIADPYYSVVSSPGGEIGEDTSFTAVGRSGLDRREPQVDELSPAPFGTLFFYLPKRIPYGKRKSSIELIAHQNEKTFAVGMVPPPGYTRTLLPAYENRSREFLPFFSYSMGAFKNGEFYIAAVPTERSPRWDPSQYDTIDLAKRIKLRLNKSPSNRLLRHLAHCAQEYHCYNAQNIFMGRWEGGIPVSHACNADCCGCISKKRKDPPHSPQKRISFIPRVGEIVEIAVEHLGAGSAIVSFGQGCEGEPLLQSRLIEEAIRLIRQKTDRGTVHINTNASMPSSVKKLIEAGLDSIRISMNSAIEDHYNLFYRPSGYAFSAVKKTLHAAQPIFRTINLLIMPGVSDSEEEMSELFRFMSEFKPNMIQLRNLNIDPDMFFQRMPQAKGKKIGIPSMIRRLEEEFPEIRLGSFSPALRE